MPKIIEYKVLYKYCRNCGKQFFLSSPNKKFCTDECRIKFTAKKRKVPEYAIIKCQRCGKEFRPIRKDNIFCGILCKNKYWTEVRRKPVILNHFSERTLLCKNCGKEFRPKHISQLYCSAICKRDFWIKDRRAKNKLAKENSDGEIS